ncbi:MAG TPA: carbon-nitrogen hydrolase family protein [Verrucomicrobiae bacterium]|nr:carbon-nitrogen hydrolase family protein [Verrucomicrobiae bacterium]
MNFTLAMIQMRVEGGQKQGNLQHAGELVGRAAGQGAGVVLLPEAMPLGWTHGSARKEADAIPDGQSCAALRQLAREHRIYVCSGVIERDGERIYNSAVLVGPEGDLLLHHRKLNELDIAHDLYGRGDRLNVAHTPLGTFGVMICADAFVQGQVISRTLGVMGAQIILSPCAWAVDARHNNERDPYGQLWLDSYQPVAREFRLWIAGCSNVGPITDGPWKGRKCIGCSLVISPTGEPVTRGEYGEDAETILFTRIETKRA